MKKNQYSSKYCFLWQLVVNLQTLNHINYEVYLSVESEDLEDGFDEEPLNDQQWILQRKKIGLSRRTKRSLRRVNQTESKNRNVSSFLKSFKRKECLRFVKDPNSKGRPLAAGPGKVEEACFCGAPRDQHKTRSVNPFSLSSFFHPS